MKHKRTFTLRGRLWADPEQVSANVVKIPIVVNERYRDGNGEWQEKSEWFKPVAFGKQAELALAYLRKGTAIEVQGELQNRSYEKDGQKHYTMDLVVDEFTPLVEMKLSEAREPPPESRQPASRDEGHPPSRPARAVEGGRSRTPAGDAPPLGMRFT